MIMFALARFNDAFSWIKRHWITVLVIILLLYLLPTFLFALAYFFRAFGDAAGRYFGTKAGEAVSKAATKIFEFAAKQTWIFAALLMLINPFLGLFIFAWQGTDKFKSGPNLTVVKPASPEVPAPAAPAAQLLHGVLGLFGIGK